MEGWSTRAQYVYKRTYSREKDDGTFETWPETVDRVIGHQRWLWERAAGRRLKKKEVQELEQLRQLLLERKGSLAGRTLWLGGTEVSKRREATQFNCAFLRLATVNDLVDGAWLLLLGCGIGFKPAPGSLFGFARPVEEVECIPSTRTSKGGDPRNWEHFDRETAVWTIRIGDSAEAWAKALGKLLAHPFPARKLVLDFSQIRPAGIRLKGFGWISAGYKPLERALLRIVGILNSRTDDVLRAMDIRDIMNMWAEVLSTRRASEIAILDYGHPEWLDHAGAKRDLVETPWRMQSNDSLVFWHQPSREELVELFDIIQMNGGIEPGLINGAAATQRAPYFAGLNPCAEILLPDKGFCNLVTLNVAAFGQDFDGMMQAARLLGRANYRQTCVDLRDGVLQDQWHHNNAAIRLCGVSLNGLEMNALVSRNWLRLHELKVEACGGAESMARELGLPRPKMTTTEKPEGTQSKMMDVFEGAHRPGGRWIFNWIVVPRHDASLPLLIEAGYEVMDHPTSMSDVVVKFPVEWPDLLGIFTEVGGVKVNVEPACSQLDRYLHLMRHYVEHNCSITVSYDKAEIPEIIDWLLEHWDGYVAVSFAPRVDPTKTAADWGVPYLPQEVVTQEQYEEYVARLKPVDLSGASAVDELMDSDCVGGVCPVR